MLCSVLFLVFKQSAVPGVAQNVSNSGLSFSRHVLPPEKQNSSRLQLQDRRGNRLTSSEDEGLTKKTRLSFSFTSGTFFNESREKFRMMASASSSYDDRLPLLGSSPSRGASLTSAPSRPILEVESVRRPRTVSVVSAAIPDEDDLNLVSLPEKSHYLD